MPRVSPAIHTAEKAQGTGMRHSIAVASSWGPGREGSVETLSRASRGQVGCSGPGTVLAGPTVKTGQSQDSSNSLPLRRSDVSCGFQDRHSVM